jgi:DNA invertase Pin-like site-specific DNA recombinase
MRNVRRVGIYVRVSTEAQHVDMQETELRAYAQARGWVVHRVYVDRGVSGVRSSRPGLNAMWTDCRRRKISICMVWALDRLSRSLKDLIGALEQFRLMEIDFVCLKQDLDTSTAAGRLLFHVVASVAEFERDLIRDRVKAGMAAARGRGKHIGRPPLRKFSASEVTQIRTTRERDRTSIRQLAIRYGTTQWMVQKLLAGEAGGSQNDFLS